MIRVLPSLELNWLSLDKHLSLPPVLFEETTENYSGCFIHPHKGEWWVDGIPIDARKGIIIIGKQDPNTANTLAHEYRHLWQYCNGWNMDSKGYAYWSTFPKTLEDYKRRIVGYFTTSRCEMDALLWSQKKAPAEHCEEWLTWIRNPLLR